jgi:tellurite resistance protein
MEFGRTVLMSAYVEARRLYRTSRADRPKAAAMMRGLAEAGDYSAMCAYGEWLLDGDGIPADVAGGLNWLKLAAPHRPRAAQLLNIHAQVQAATVSQVVQVAPAPAPTHPPERREEAPAPAQEPSKTDLVDVRESVALGDPLATLALGAQEWVAGNHEVAIEILAVLTEEPLAFRVRAAALEASGASRADVGNMLERAAMLGDVASLARLDRDFAEYMPDQLGEVARCIRNQPDWNSERRLSRPEPETGAADLDADAILERCRAFVARDAVLPRVEQLVVGLPWRAQNESIRVAKAALIGQREGIIGFGELAHGWTREGSIDDASATRMVDTLARVGIGIVPDPRRDQLLADLSDDVHVFAEALSPTAGVVDFRYQRAALVARLSVGVSAIDGHLDERERKQVVSNLHDSLELPLRLLTRLDRLVGWLTEHDPRMQSAIWKLAEFDDVTRRDIAEDLVRVAAADERIDPAEEALLREIYESSGLGVGLLVTDLARIASHEAVDSADVDGTDGDEPVRAPRPIRTNVDLDVLRAFGASTAEYEDLDEIERQIAESFQASRRGYSVQMRPAQVSSHARPHRLDGAAELFLWSVLRRDIWSPADIDARASAQGMDVDKAVEAVNAWGFEFEGEPIIEYVNDVVTVKVDRARDLLD